MQLHLWWKKATFVHDRNPFSQKAPQLVNMLENAHAGSSHQWIQEPKIIERLQLTQSTSSSNIASDQNPLTLRFYESACESYIS